MCVHISVMGWTPESLLKPSDNDVLHCRLNTLAKAPRGMGSSSPCLSPHPSLPPPHTHPNHSSWRLQALSFSLSSRSCFPGGALVPYALKHLVLVYRLGLSLFQGSTTLSPVSLPMGHCSSVSPPLPPRLECKVHRRREPACRVPWHPAE